MCCSFNVLFLLDFSTEPHHNIDTTMDSVSALDTSTPMDVSSSLAPPKIHAMCDPMSLVVDIASLVVDYALSQASASFLGLSLPLTQS